MPAHFIVTGATGAFGSRLLPALMRRHPESQVLALCRSRQAAEAAAWLLPGDCRPRLLTVLADLAHPQAVARAMLQLPDLDSALAIHLAAAMSWDASAQALAPLNVLGTLRLAELLERKVRAPKLVFMSTALTRLRGWPYRNGLEATKAAAHRALADGFGRRHPLCVFSSGLLVGIGAEGRIGRFHGAHALLHHLAQGPSAAPLAQPAQRIDLVPIDWAVQQLIHAVDLLDRNQAPAEVVASSGDQQLSCEQLRLMIEERRHRSADADGPAPAPQPPRLDRSLDAWCPDPAEERELRGVERWLALSATPAWRERSRPPLNLLGPAPPPQAYLPRVLEVWLQARRPPAGRQHDAATA